MVKGRLEIIAERFKTDDFDEDTLRIFSLLAFMERFHIEGRRGVSQRVIFERSADAVSVPRIANGKYEEALIELITTMADPGAIRENVQQRYNINERFEFIEELARMTRDKAVRGFVVTGSGGLGKSYTVEKELANESDVIITKGYISARALFDQMAQFPSAIHVFDDADSVLEDKSAVNLLKAALDTGNRTVHWNTFNQDAEPFEFKGAVIIISNKSLADVPQPILSRSLFVDVTMTSDEKMERIRTILHNIDDGLEPDQQEEVLALMTEYKSMIDDLNVRTYLKVAAIRRVGSARWKDIAIYQLTTRVAV